MRARMIGLLTVTGIAIATPVSMSPAAAQGVTIETPAGERRFVDAPEVARTAERGITLTIPAEQVAELPPPPAGQGVTGAARKLFRELRRG